MQIEPTNFRTFDEVGFESFKKKNRLFYDFKKKKWNKEFRPIVKTVWIKDKRFWNKGLKKHGYFQTYTTGWEMGLLSAKKCRFCGKLLTDKQTKFCSNLNHKKQFHKILKKAKDKFDFSLDKGVIFMPCLYNYTIDQSGEWHEVRNEIKRIENKEIKFSMDGRTIQLTTKSRTI